MYAGLKCDESWEREHLFSGFLCSFLTIIDMVMLDGRELLKLGWGWARVGM
jgi:hypothetical protein